MPVKDLILLVVYLLVTLACNIDIEKKPFASELCQLHDSHSLNGDLP